MNTLATKLIITEHIPKILSVIEENLVSQVNAATGSGKSIGIPKALAESGKRVFVAVPTRVAATSLCNFLHTLNKDLSVGYAAEGNVMYDNTTAVVYATSGHVRRKLLSYFGRGGLRGRTGLDFTDVLVIDETHSGSLDNTVILSLWMYAHKLGVPVPKLLLLSATPTNMPVKPEAFVYPVPVPTPFPVEVVYDAPDEEDQLYDHALEVIMSQHRDTRIKGDFLVFVPGAREADELVQKIRDEASDSIVLPAYSVLDSDELRMIYDPAPNGERKVIVATNIAESSITIHGVEVIIDTMLCKEAMATASGATRLETVKITKDSAKQRLGRAGRTRPGKCIRLINETAFELLDSHRVPEIERVPLHNVVMEFLKAGIDPVEAIVGIDSYRVRQSVELLKRLEMLKEEQGTLIVTPCGDFAPSVPLGVRNAAFLWRWIEKDKPIYPGAVIASIIDAHSIGYFWLPRKRKEMTPFEYNIFCDEYIQKTFKAWIGETPLHTYLNMWAAFTKSLPEGLHYRLADNPSKIHYREWAKKNSVHQRQFWELMSIVSQTYKAVRGYVRRRIDVNVAPFDLAEAIQTAVPILQAIYADNAMTPNYDGEMRHPQTGVKHVFDNRRRISIIERIRRGRIVPLATHEIVTRQGYPMGYVDLCVPFPIPPLSPSTAAIHEVWVQAMDQSTPPPERKNPSPERKETREGEYEVMRSRAGEQPVVRARGEQSVIRPRGEQPVVRARGEQPIARGPPQVRVTLELAPPRMAPQPVQARTAPQPAQPNKFRSPYAVLEVDSDDSEGEYPYDGWNGAPGFW
jgi:HrpA-like RNA helicase